MVPVRIHLMLRGQRHWHGCSAEDLLMQRGWIPNQTFQHEWSPLGQSSILREVCGKPSTLARHWQDAREPQLNLELHAKWSDQGYVPSRCGPSPASIFVASAAGIWQISDRWSQGFSPAPHPRKYEEIEPDEEVLTLEAGQAPALLDANSAPAQPPTLCSMKAGQIGKPPSPPSASLSPSNLVWAPGAPPLDHLSQASEDFATKVPVWRGCCQVCPLQPQPLCGHWLLRLPKLATGVVKGPFSQLYKIRNIEAIDGYRML